MFIDLFILKSKSEMKTQSQICMYIGWRHKHLFEWDVITSCHKSSSCLIHRKDKPRILSGIAFNHRVSSAEENIDLNDSPDVPWPNDKDISDWRVSWLTERDVQWSANVYSVGNTCGAIHRRGFALRINRRGLWRYSLKKSVTVAFVRFREAWQNVSA